MKIKTLFWNCPRQCFGPKEGHAVVCCIFGFHPPNVCMYILCQKYYKTMELSRGAKQGLASPSDEIEGRVNLLCTFHSDSTL